MYGPFACVFAAVALVCLALASSAGAYPRSTFFTRLIPFLTKVATRRR